jgi:hypothetical protein
MNYTFKLFTEINCFDDMVEANLSYLREPTSDCNDIDKNVFTPTHLSPLREESQMIVDGLQKLCTRHRVMTMSSQPAYTTKGFRRQCGYIHGVLSLPGVPLTSLGEALEKVGGLEYCLCRRTRFDRSFDSWEDRLNLERVERVNVLGHPIVSQWWRDQSWSTEEVTSSCCGGEEWAEDMFEHLEAHEDCNEYGSYFVTEDPSIIVFSVADDSFDLGVSHCCDKLHEALDLVERVILG